MSFEIVKGRPETKDGRGRHATPFTQAIVDLKPGESVVYDATEDVTPTRNLRTRLSTLCTLARACGLRRSYRLEIWQASPFVYVYKKLDTDE